MKRIPSYLAVAGILAFVLLSCRTISGVPANTNIFESPALPLVTPVIQQDRPVVAPPVLDLTSTQDALVQLYEAANPGVVAIRVLTDQGRALGSGFVIDMDGHIITNYHVVENETRLEVTFASGFKDRGEVVGTDLDSDIAVIKVDAPKEELHPLQMGDSDQIKVGQAVVAIGNPFELEGTMTTGIVSGLGRTLQSLHASPDGSSNFSAGDIIQTDAAINPGNSGGPLLNLNGEVIGINQAIRSTSFAGDGSAVNSGVGFAISINMVKRVIPFLIRDGKYDYPYLGIYSRDGLSLLELETIGLSRSTGVYVTEVVSGGPADLAGIRGGTRDTQILNLPAGGDLIIGIDGRPVRNYNDLIGYLTKTKSPGETVVLTVLREDEELELSLVLDKRPIP
jgi:2-alkenal reductase